MSIGPGVVQQEQHHERNTASAQGAGVRAESTDARTASGPKSSSKASRCVSSSNAIMPSAQQSIAALAGNVLRPCSLAHTASGAAYLHAVCCSLLRSLVARGPGHAESKLACSVHVLALPASEPPCLKAQALRPGAQHAPSQEERTSVGS